MCKWILNIFYKLYLIYRAKKNTKGYCLSKNKTIVDTYKINEIGGLINNSNQNINLNEINTINNRNIINGEENSNLFENSINDENKLDLDAWNKSISDSILLDSIN